MPYIIARADGSYLEAIAGDNLAASFVPQGSGKVPHMEQTEDAAEQAFISWMEAKPARSFEGAETKYIGVDVIFDPDAESFEDMDIPGSAPVGIRLWLLDPATGTRLGEIGTAKPVGGRYTIEAEVDADKVHFHLDSDATRERSRPFVLTLRSADGVGYRSLDAKGSHNLTAIAFKGGAEVARTSVAFSF